MSLRSRILLAFLIVVLVPAAIMWFGARREIEERLRDQYRARVASLASVIEEDLAREDREIHRRLSALTDRLSADNRFRATADGVEDRAYLLDLAPEAMAITGLSMLQIHDPDGRIVSSGHFRNAFDVVAPHLPRALSSLRGGSALTTVRTPGGQFLGLVRVDSVRIGDAHYHVVGGRRVGEEFLSGLARDPELSVRLVHPAGVLRSKDPTGPAPAEGATGIGPTAVDESTGIGLTEREAPGDRDDPLAITEVARAIAVPFVEGTDEQPNPGLESSSPTSSPSPPSEPAEARFEIAFDGAVLDQIRRSTNLWFGLVLAGATAVSLLLAGWLSGRVTQPLRALASQARRVDLDRLDVPFPIGRRDEIGELSRVLKGMTRRIRAGTRELRDAERRATLGELARQVNHDVRNGLVPIRNVFRHLDDVAREFPERLADVFRERRGSLASSVSYLESLAGNYSRLSRKAGSGSADAVSVSRRVVEGAAAESDVPVQMESAVDAAPVRGDAVTIRRIVENLVANAKDAVREGERRIPGSPGRVVVRVEGSNSSETVRILVEDTGRGMSEEERGRAFEDFYTTREGGTGLGLPVVRRLVRDLGGEVRLESEKGRGTRMTVDLPAGRDHRESGGSPAREEAPESGSAENRREETAP